MDKIKVGDILRKGNATVTVTDIYLFQMHPQGEWRPVIVYDWQNGSEKKKGETSFNLIWEGWEKV